MNFQVNDQVSLSAPHAGDADALVEWLSTGDVQKTTCEIPFPYLPANAQAFIDLTHARAQKFGRQMEWSIRSADGKLIGIIGLKGGPGFHQGKDEVGFWLARPYWGQGIMTQVLGGFIRVCFEIYFLQGLDARIFTDNKASIAVVQKCGFVLTPDPGSRIYKDGACRNVSRYALDRKNWNLQLS